MRPYLRVFDDVFYLGKNQWQYFSSEKFSFNESQRFFKDFGRRYFDGASCCFYFGAWKMRTIAPVKFCVWYLGLLHYVSDDCHISSGTMKSPLLWKRIGCLRAFSTTDMGEGKESFIDLCWPLLTFVLSQLSLVPDLQNRVTSLSQLVKTLVLGFFFFIRGSSFPHLVRSLHN